MVSRAHPQRSRGVGRELDLDGEAETTEDLRFTDEREPLRDIARVSPTRSLARTLPATFGAHRPRATSVPTASSSRLRSLMLGCETKRSSSLANPVLTASALTANLRIVRPSIIVKAWVAAVRPRR